MSKIKVIPLFKSGNKLDCGNYRPISLIPVISKIYERILKTRIVSFVEKFGLMHSKPFGKRSTVDAITDIIDKIRTDNSN